MTAGDAFVASRMFFGSVQAGMRPRLAGIDSSPTVDEGVLVRFKHPNLYDIQTNSEREPNSECKHVCSNSKLKQQVVEMKLKVCIITY
jgi:hypothetical protein